MSIKKAIDESKKKSLKLDLKALELDEIPHVPHELFKTWFEEAGKCDLIEPTTMALSTVDPETFQPTSRMVLLKKMDPQAGYTFFTNYNSQKAKDLDKNPKACVLFYWDIMQRQVRIQGTVTKTSREDSVKYFKSRTYMSQLASAVSDQSDPLIHREALEKKIELAKKTFPEDTLECPEHWGGYTLKANHFEFWQGRLHRLHDRIQYKWDGKEWHRTRLSP